METEKMIEVKHGSENMVDLLNQEQAELKTAMIEEMAKDLNSFFDETPMELSFRHNSGEIDVIKDEKALKVLDDIIRQALIPCFAKFLTEQGYRKTTEGAVVLTRDEWEKYQITQRDWNAIYYDGIDKARKETAREIIKFVSEHCDNESLVWMLEEFVSKKLGVEEE